MKTQLLRALYRLVAFLAEKTKGFGLFTQWKLVLGSLLLSITVTSCVSKKSTHAVDEPKVNPLKEHDVSCYIATPVDPLQTADTTANINVEK